MILTDFSLCLGCVFLVVISSLILLWYGNFPRYRKRNIRGEPATTIARINGSILGPDNLLSFYQSRSIENQRLAQTFRMRNGFTSSDPSECVDFKRTAIKLLHNFDDIPELMRHAKNVADEAIAFFVEANNDSELPMARLFRVMVLWFTVPQIFQDQVIKLDIYESVRLTDAINNLWIASKNRPSSSDAILREQYGLFAALQKMFPDYDPSDPKLSPLTFIIPSYETMWRAVLLCFLETMCHGCSVRSDWHKRFTMFFNNPDEKEFQKQNLGISVEALVLETLRCYPPTKSIYRTVPNSKFQNLIQQLGLLQGSPTNIPGVHREVADIQGLHRDPALWGERADQFWPYRWCQGDKEQKMKREKVFLAFGCQPYQCPARKTGPLLIGIMVAAFREALGRSYMLEGLGSGVERQGLIESGRAAFEDLKLRRAVDI